MKDRTITSAVLVALIAACGPKQPGESDGASSGEASTGSTGEPTPTTGEPTPTTGEPAPTTDEPEPSTGEPMTCPEGQEHLAPLWKLDISLTNDLSASVRAPLGRLADGTIVLPADLSLFPGPTGPGMLQVSPDGEFLGALPMPTEQAAESVQMLRVGADDQPRMLTERLEGDQPILVLRRFASDGAPLEALDIVSPRPKFAGQGPSLLALADAPVIVGIDEMQGGFQLTKLMPDAGAAQWLTALTGPFDLNVRALVVGPDGSIVVGAIAMSDNGYRRVMLWRFAGDGGELWSREISTEGFDDLTGLSFVQGDQIVVLRAGGSSNKPRQVTLLAVEVDDGATRWELPVAVPDAVAGNPWANDLLVGTDALTIPITRNLGIDHGILVSTRSLEIARVSFQGTMIDSVPVPGAMAGPGVDDGRAVLGRCGELVVLSLDDHFDHRLEAFAP